MNTYFNLADWIIIFAYLGGIIALGLWFGKDQHNTRDYFLGSKNVPWWGIGLSIVSAETSALTIIGVPAIAYGGNILFIQMIVGYVIARIILAVVMVPHYLSVEIYSPYQLLETHLGRGPRRLAGAFFLFVTGALPHTPAWLVLIGLLLAVSVASANPLAGPSSATSSNGTFWATVIMTCWSLAFGPRLTSQTLLPGAFFARFAAS